MGTEGQGDLGELVRRNAGLVEVALRQGRHHDRRREHPEGREEVVAGSRRIELAVAPRLPLAERAQDNDVVGDPGFYGELRLHQGGAGAGAAAAPRHRRIAQIGKAKRILEVGGLVAVASVGYDAVDLVHRQPRIGDGMLDRLAGQAKLAAVLESAPPAVFAFADADDTGALSGSGHGEGPLPAERSFR
jgi:hypothetical protein